jgi:putative addiction module killer protein
MILKEHAVFSEWLARQDDDVVVIIIKRLARVAVGNFGDTKSVGDGVSELRIQYGSGYRIYYTIRGQKIIILLCAGDKSSQKKDINKAKELSKGILK